MATVKPVATAQAGVSYAESRATFATYGCFSQCLGVLRAEPGFQP